MGVLRHRAVVSGMASIVMLLSFLISGYDFKPAGKVEMEVFYPDPLVELHLQDATVAEAFARLEARYNVKVELDGVIPGTVTCAFSRMPMSHVLQVLAGNQQYQVKQNGTVFSITPRNGHVEETAPITVKKSMPVISLPHTESHDKTATEAQESAIAITEDPLLKIQEFWNNGQRKNAIQSLEKHLQSQATDTKALIMLGDFHKAERHLRSALNCWDKALEIQGKNSDLVTAREELEILIGFVEAECKRYPEGKTRKKLEVYLR